MKVKECHKNRIVEHEQYGRGRVLFKAGKKVFVEFSNKKDWRAAFSVYPSTLVPAQ
jgi:hypothetical protein